MVCVFLVWSSTLIVFFSSFCVFECVTVRAFNTALSLSMPVTSKWAILLDTVSEWQLESGFGSQLKVFWHHTVFGSSAYACCCFYSRVHTLTNTDSVSIPGDIICPQLYSSCFHHALSLLNAPTGQLQWYFTPTSRRLMYATSWSCYSVCLAGVDRAVQNEQQMKV